ncbi:MAG: PCYCGC motif-containing (lipo)protein [Vicinamibacterales bacterium]
MPLVAGVLALALIGGGFMYVRSARLQPEPAPAADAAQSAPIPTGLKPHPQANLPPLQFPGYPMSRSPEVVTAAYRFAAEHPEVLSYVPCFCGCERSGHRGNEDCFVKARDINGDVVLWDDHGMECAVCLDVATRARLMHAAGASVREIRTAIDKEWGSKSTNHTHTPEPPTAN